MIDFLFKEKSLKSIISILFILAFLVTSLMAYKNAINLNPWSLGDWLINYQGGFVRRGLSGEIYYMFSNYLKISPEYFVFGTQIILYAIFYIVSFLLIKNELQNKEYLLLIFSPVIFYFQVFDLAAVGRKEILYLSMFALMIYFIKNANNRKSETTIYIFIFLFSVLILMHEMFIIYFPYIIIVFILKIGLKNKIKKILIISSLPIISFFLSLFYKGDSIVAIEIFNSLHNIGCNIKGGAIGSIGWTTSDGLRLVWKGVSELNYIPKYILATILSLLAFYPIIYKFRIILSNKLNLLLLFLSIIGTILVMVVAWDWGRFIYIHIASLFFISLLISSDSEYKVTFLNKIPNICFLLLIIINFSIWRLPHCCSGNIFLYQFHMIFKALSYIGL